MEEQQFQDWLARLLEVGLSETIKTKLARGELLTHDEMQMFIRLVAIAEEMKSTENFDSIVSALDRLNRKVNQSLDNEREILYHVSDDKESYAVQKDLRRPNSFKEAILQVTLGEIAKRPLEERRAVALKFFNEFKGYPEFYHDFKTFIRQIDRMRKSSLPKG